MKRLIIAWLLFGAANCYGVEFRRAESLDDARASVCRVCVSGARGSGARGSGWFAGVENDVCYIVTNYHVVTNNKTARLDFWTNGKLESVNGSIVERAYDANMPADFACVKVSADELKKIDPPFLPIGGEDAKPSVGAIVVSAGAPDGRFVQAWKGMVLEYYNGKTAIFSPPPVPGQSGSPICEYVDGELFATGILTWLIGERGRDESKGGAIPISNLYKVFKRSTGIEVDYEEGGDPIPPDATECVEEHGTTTNASAPCVVMLSQENCPPCKEALKDAAELREKKIPVYVYDVNSEYGAQLAQRFKADRTPTFFVLDTKYAPVGRFIGAGVASQVADAYGAVTVDDSCPIRDGAAPGMPADDRLETDAAHAADSRPASLGGRPLPTGGPARDAGPGSEPAAPDFRSRPSVYDISSNVGFLEDSNDRWLNRGRKDAPKTAEPEKKPKLGERLTDSVVDSIVGRVANAIEKKGAEMKESALNAWQAAKTAILFAFVALVALGVMLAQACAAILKWSWRKLAALVGEFREFKRVAIRSRESQKDKREESEDKS
ncbi:MAG: trypsin-like peptidase domain-containing protein [Thermoguttaceae bacterium]|nr:trypsin-like peptidase domain-containing protein [Thermoguttaceae bacterium]